jgi:hypothetical protein
MPKPIAFLTSRAAPEVLQADLAKVEIVDAATSVMARQPKTYRAKSERHRLMPEELVEVGLF